MTGLEWTHKCSKRNSVINIQDFPARNASGRASIALRRSAKAAPACRRWSPPASCTCTCSAAVDAILHSFKNAQVVILDNDRSLSWIMTCKCALCSEKDKRAQWYCEDTCKIQNTHLNEQHFDLDSFCFHWITYCAVTDTYDRDWR